ncbi:sigma-70 family RNA polymerase sigma factor [Okeania sp. SIO1I7]|uniref:sigma-70 family RNA polymerase sigma factor n=1 Tax=Okeania sp. SIO1I7 TaxID=2607772 RepID=UPI0013F9C305|nr:sigma-70 family RNA polymerase sigma factor [Okeania sp. SIO1I7]NET29825.1 sigma-70 family RNA polymerase sigma factor [Okeania sp. SIO1I7]
MRIRIRTSISEMFSTFLDVTNDFNLKKFTWITDYQLKSNMDSMMKKNPDKNDEEYWSKYWLKKAISEQDILARKHLNSYLEETCFWAAISVENKLNRYNKLIWSMIDLIQIAREMTCYPEFFFKISDLYDNSKVKNYASIALKNYLLAVVNKHNNLNRYSEWGILRNITKKTLINTLREVGFNEPKLSSLILAWKAFNAIYIPKKIPGYASSRLKIPTSEEFNSMADYYNKQQSLNYSMNKSVNISDIKYLLKSCIQAVRQSNKIEFPSILESNNLEVISSLPDQSFNFNDSEEYLELRIVLEEKLGTLPDEAKKIFILYYGLAMSQTEMSKILGFQQYQISRKLKRYEQTFLKVIVNWSQINKSLQSDKLREFSRLLDEWLTNYFKNNFYELLTTILIQELDDEIPILLYYYGASNSVELVAGRFNISKFEVLERVKKVKKILQEKLHIWIQTTLEIDFDSLKSVKVNKSIAALVEEWLSIAPYAAFQIE